jgi:hypothetical protein
MAHRATYRVLISLRQNSKQRGKEDVQMKLLFSKSVWRPVLAVLIGGMAFAASATQAQTITENLTADLGGFIPLFGNTLAAPVTTVDASFTIAFNEASSITGATTGLTVDSFSGLPAGGTYEYSWNPTLHVLEIGATYLTSEAEIETGFTFNLTNPAAPTLSVCSDPGQGGCLGSPTYYESGYGLATDGFSGSWAATVANGVPATSVPEINGQWATSGLTLLLGGLVVVTARRRST